MLLAIECGEAKANRAVTLIANLTGLQYRHIGHQLQLFYEHSYFCGNGYLSYYVMCMNYRTNRARCSWNLTTCEIIQLLPAQWRTHPILIEESKRVSMTHLVIHAPPPPPPPHIRNIWYTSYHMDVPSICHFIRYYSNWSPNYFPVTLNMTYNTPNTEIVMQKHRDFQPFGPKSINIFYLEIILLRPLYMKCEGQLHHPIRSGVPLVYYTRNIQWAVYRTWRPMQCGCRQNMAQWVQQSPAIRGILTVFSSILLWKALFSCV